MVLIAGALICVVGVVDDLIELDALTKLGGQILAAAVLVLGDVKLYSLKLPGVGQFVLDPAQAVLLTMLLVVGTVNAVNFVDGLDGLAAGVVLIGAVAFFLFSYKLADGNGETLAITAAMLCAAIGAPAPASCRTTSSRPGSSWATPARCCSGSCSPAPRSPSPASSPA